MNITNDEVDVDERVKRFADRFTVHHDTATVIVNDMQVERNSSSEVSVMDVFRESGTIVIEIDPIIGDKMINHNMPVVSEGVRAESIDAAEVIVVTKKMKEGDVVVIDREKGTFGIVKDGTIVPLSLLAIWSKDVDVENEQGGDL